MTDGDERMLDVERRISRLEAAAAAQSLIAAHHSLHSAAASAAVIMQLCWAADEDVQIELGPSGVFVGPRKVASFYEKDPSPGRFVFAVLGSPDITVSASADSVHAAWSVIGIDTDAGELGPAPPQTAEDRRLLTSVTSDGAAYRAEIVWQRIEARLTRQADHWRIRALHFHDIARHPFGRDWVLWAERRFDTDGLRLDAAFRSNIPFGPDEPPENNPSGPTTRHWQYTLESDPPFPVSPWLDRTAEERPS